MSIAKTVGALALVAALVLGLGPGRALAYTSAPAPTLTEVPGSPFGTDPNGVAANAGDLNFSWGPDGRTAVVANRLVSGSYGGSLTLMNVDASGALTLTGASTGLANYPGAIAYDPQGGYVAVAGAANQATSGQSCGEGCLSLYAIGSGGTFTQVGPVLDAGQIQSLAFSPDGNTLLVSTQIVPGQSGTAVEGYAVNGGGLSPGATALLPSGAIPIGGIAVNPAGSRAAVADAGNAQVDLLAVGDGGNVAFLSATPTGEPVPDDAAFSPDGSLLAVADRDTSNGEDASYISMFNVGAGGSLSALAGSPFADPSTQEVLQVAFSSRGWLAAVLGDGSLVAFNVGADGSLNEPAVAEAYPGGSPGEFAFSPSGQFLAVPEAGSDQVAVFADHAPPTATIASPANGGTYAVGQPVPTSFSCADSTGAPGIASCTDSNGATQGAGALNTSKAGTFAYAVTAVSQDGLSTTVQITYTVSATASPSPSPSPSPTPSPSPAPSPAPSPTPTPSPSPTAKPAPATGPLTLSSTVTPGSGPALTLANPNAYSVTYQVSLTATAPSLKAHAVPARRSEARATSTPAKPVTIATARVTLAAHKARMLKLTLSKAAAAVLRRNHRLTVSVHITVTSPGHSSRTVTRNVTLRSPATRRG